jgi:primosomal protein N' (replication factor Y) (superfamily II helicase)
MPYIQVALDVPLPTLFDYAWPVAVAGESVARDQIIGRRVIVPFGRRNVTGLAVSISDASAFDAARIKPMREVLIDIAPLPPAWLALMRFCAGYYQHPLGAAALSALPQGLKSGKTLDPLLTTRLAWRGVEPVWPKREHVRAAMAARLQAATQAGAAGPVYGCDLAGASPKALAYLAQWRAEGCVIEAAPPPFAVGDAPALNPEQITAVEQIAASINERDGAGSYRAHLLHGVTGSGKTEVYLRAAAAALQRGRQVLMLVPEINLTPRLMQSVRARFPTSTIVALHSELNESERLHSWLLAHAGEAGIVLGTRLAVLASLPRLGLIVVDEEHDPSFKQQEGMRYSARDLAVFRAHQENVPIVLGSATPSLETYAHAESGRYARLTLKRRAVADSVLPRVRLIDLNTAPLEHGVSAAVRDA